MKFTLSEWESIKIALGTALFEEEECLKSLEKESKTNPEVIRDLCESTLKVAELANFIDRIEHATV
jgi:hypothetical protein